MQSKLIFLQFYMIFIPIVLSIVLHNSLALYYLSCMHLFRGIKKKKNPAIVFRTCKIENEKSSKCEFFISFLIQKQTAQANNSFD